MLGKLHHMICMKNISFVTTVYAYKSKNRITRKEKTHQTFVVVVLVSDLWKQIGSLFLKGSLEGYQIL